MYYVDSQRTITRRDSSLITSRIGRPEGDTDTWSVYHDRQTPLLYTTDSTGSVANRPKGSVQKELVTMMFESMLHSIVESWEIIAPPKQVESYTNLDFGKTVSETFTFTGKKKSKPIIKSSKTKPSRSKLGLSEITQIAEPVSWWSAPDEKALIRFRNGNTYEGNISMKCMHGEGRFQWADGTVYLGQFKDNEMVGKGLIQWHDDTWYQGEFSGNLRHGQGLYVDSRLQRSYAGGWHCGTKHGEGVIYYDKSFKNSYDGQWIHNERFGYGSREYCASSGYQGEWDRNIREGKGLMIWPNTDFYRGEWKNGVMSGYGIYIWDAYYNNTLSLPSLNAYRGYWEKGQRNGYGVLNLGLGYGSFYKGDFKNNKKNGVGRFVTNSGLILQDKNLFIDDTLGPMKSIDHKSSNDMFKNASWEPFQFDICDSSVGLSYHIDQALKNLDKQEEIRTNIINDYIENNKLRKSVEVQAPVRKDERDKDLEEHNPEDHLEDLIVFEESSLRKSLRCYETDLENIYYRYATICNNMEVYFKPVMIRLFLWQLYYDCNIHEKGMTLFDIDILYYQNREWLARSPHDPFEKIYFWQFIHSLITVASKLYAKRHLPGARPDTILASAFRKFMEEDVLPGSNEHKGRLVNGFGAFVPLKAAYKLYRTIGEPHTVRNFLRGVYRSPHVVDRPSPPMFETPDEFLPLGRNVYIFGDEMSFIVDDHVPEQQQQKIITDSLKLFNFANLSSKTIIKIFAKIFPQIHTLDKIMDLNIKLTFFEFFEAFVDCAEESIKVKDEEIKWREKLSCVETTPAPHSTPTGFMAKPK
ncbi:uncharacterized protein LOC142987498 [Anticarsia gemmatalis]|uniref:uncharacterized protein LOC142987498 n=1 Tax=Anticarsia gemmatalis TaxID=129554 RepID=UPI003F7735FA